MPFLASAIRAHGLPHPRSPRPGQHSKVHASGSSQTLGWSDGEGTGTTRRGLRIAFPGTYLQTHLVDGSSTGNAGPLGELSNNFRRGAGGRT
jgi:hypothetical protein